MPLYAIEQYEIHKQTHHVEAESKAEALKKLLNGKSTEVGRSTFSCVAEGYYQPLELSDDDCMELEADDRFTEPYCVDTIASIDEITSDNLQVTP